MARVWRHQFKRTTLWLVLFIGILVGLGMARAGWDIGVAWLLLAATIMVLAIRKRQLPAVLAVIILGLCCGICRGAGYMRQLAPYDALLHKPVTLSVTASSDAAYNKHKQLAFDAEAVTLENGQMLRGKLQVSGYGENAIFQGDELEVTGKLYPGYGTYQGKVSFAKLDTIAHHPSVITAIKQKFTAGAQTALPEPLAAFVMGLLVGQRTTLPDQVKEDFTKVGLTHIVAVSGANLTIILNACQKLFGKRSKRMATSMMLGLIMTFVLLTAGSASIVRAAIVSLLSITASYYGRSFKPLNLITLAAVITAWANPVYIWSDLGWYLSFLAFFGVMVLSPLVQLRWPARWHQNILGSVALESVCAEALSLPFVLHIFGQMSFMSLIANVLVVTAIPLAMLFGTIAGLAGMIAAPIVGWFAWPAGLVLNYMLDTAHILASLPHVFIENRSFSLPAMLGWYVLVGLFTYSLWNKTKLAGSGIITDNDQPKQRGLLA